MARVAGKVAMVTGAASGIGRACAGLLASEGAKVVATDINQVDGAALAREIESAGGEVDFFVQDVTEEIGWRDAIQRATERFGGLHILVNNAGVGGMGSPQNPEEITLDLWREINTVNLEGVFLGCKHAIPAIHDSGGGAIVNISSLAAMLATPAIAAYGAGKAGVRQYSKSVAMHCAQRGYQIRCNSVHPGVIATPMTDKMFTMRGDPEESRERVRKMIPVRELGSPQDIAYAVLYLASDESRYITGAELVVDGGLSII